jgi:hypothetical protein
MSFLRGFSNGIYGIHPNSGVGESLLVGSSSVAFLDTLNYLGLPFAAFMKNTRNLIIQVIKEKFRKTCGMLAKIKGQVDKICLRRLYNAMFATRIFLSHRFGFFFK